MEHLPDPVRIFIVSRICIFTLFIGLTLFASRPLWPTRLIQPPAVAYSPNRLVLLFARCTNYYSRHSSRKFNFFCLILPNVYASKYSAIGCHRYTIGQLSSSSLIASKMEWANKSECQCPPVSNEGALSSALTIDPIYGRSAQNSLVSIVPAIGLQRPKEPCINCTCYRAKRPKKPCNRYRVKCYIIYRYF